MLSCSLSFFPKPFPLVVRLALDKGYGATFLSLKRKVMVITPAYIGSEGTETLQVVIRSPCQNQYCTVMHSRQLMDLGFSFAEIRILIERQRPPERLGGKGLWQNTLYRLNSAFPGPHIASTLYASLHGVQDADVVEGIHAVVAFSLFHEFFLDAYSDKLNAEKEPLLRSMQSHIKELIDYLDARSTQHGGLVTICSVCKDLQVDADWTAIETEIGSLPSNTQFSHGVCPRCIVRWRNLGRRVDAG